MLIDELKEQLKALEPTVETIKTFWSNAQLDEQYRTLTQKTEQEAFWQDPEQTTILKKLTNVKNIREQYHELIESYSEVTELVDLFKHDETELIKLQEEIKKLSRKLTAFKIELLLHEPQDNSACFMNINAGAGGTESQDWANMLLRMYTRYCEDSPLTAQIIDYQPGEEAGIKSATLYIKGKNAFGMLKSEHGIHRLVRISPFDASKRRHTSFAGVMVTPEVPDVEVSIDPKDLRIDTYRASGAGGQHVNKTDSAVRITHIPTGTVVQCQNERSQTQNKATAMKMLHAKLAQQAAERQEQELAAGIEKKKIEWGSQIRSYVLHPYKMVKDHRTDYESPQPDIVLDGGLNNFIEAFLIELSKKK